jgi:hypothetical protein
LAYSYWRRSLWTLYLAILCMYSVVKKSVDSVPSTWTLYSVVKNSVDYVPGIFVHVHSSEELRGLCTSHILACTLYLRTPWTLYLAYFGMFSVVKNSVDSVPGIFWHVLSSEELSGLLPLWNAAVSLLHHQNLSLLLPLLLEC